MWKPIVTVLFLFTSTGSLCPAQSGAAKEASSPTAESPAAESEDSGSGESVLDAVEAEYRELVCSCAADFANPNQEAALQIAVKQSYQDDRFDALIKKVMKAAVEPKGWDVDKVSRAVNLVPLCTGSGEDRAELVLRCYLLCRDEARDRRLERKLMELLAVHRDETSRLVLEEMRKGDYPPKLLSLVTPVGKSSGELLPLLLKVAKSDDSELVSWAMPRVPQVINGLRNLELRKQQAAAIKKTGLGELDVKMVKYAERVISRYDKNKDGQLTRPEFETMLMSPLPADADQNGSITVPEYAAWMQSRSK